MTSLQIVELILNLWYFVGSFLEPLFFYNVFRCEFPHASGTSSSTHKFEVIRSITSTMIGWLHLFIKSGAISLLAFMFFSSLIWCSISSNDGGVLLIGKCLDIFWRLCTNEGWSFWPISCHVGAVDAEGSGGLKMQFEMFDKLLWITWMAYRF